MKSLISKYNVPGPRYTSYPTVPYWNTQNFDPSNWLNNLNKNFKISNSTDGISVYIHLPYCESLCTFCGCHKYITKRHEVESPYIDAVLKEWLMYLKHFDEKPIIKELHLGGGTPTFFAPNELKRLIEGIFQYANKHHNIDLSFEGHPNNTTELHLKTLFDLGFKRVSFGVQDYDEKVQKAIHRIQSYEKVKEVTYIARNLGYTSISHDIIYGLPFQTSKSIHDTILKTAELAPDRISFYSYAHVPWIKGNGQRGFKDDDLPKDDEKRKLYEYGRTLLEQNDYFEVGMDHFAKESDALYLSFKSGSLHRNFMGYTPLKTKVMIGLGASSISDCDNAFAQNEKNVKKYLDLIENDQIPVVKGHILNDKDLVIRHTILNIICKFKTDLSSISAVFKIKDIENRLREMINDKLVIVNDNQLIVTEKGKAFVRNICMVFDEYLINDKPETQIFSMTI